MPKVGMEQVRRRQIIAATKACIHREGIGRASIARIAREAGVAPGLVTHYFVDREDLLHETFRSIYREFTFDIRRRLARARTPEDRLLALLEAQIAPASLTPEAVSTWLAVYSVMREYPLLERIERDYDRRLISTMVDALRRMGHPVDEAREIAEELSIMIDGLWQNLANPVTFTAERARAFLYRYLARRLPGHVFVPPPDDARLRAVDDRRISPEAQAFLADNLPVEPFRLSRSTIAETRRQLGQIYRVEARAAARAHGVRLSRADLGGVESLRIAAPGPEVQQGTPRLFYLFGGGFVTGEPEHDLPISAALAAQTGAAVLSPRYRLAPEHPCPAALDDVLTAWRAFVREGGTFWLAGESAGGGLALALLQRARAEGLPQPAAVALMSPWVDLSLSLPSLNDGHDPTFTRANLQQAARLYAGGADPASPSLSPLFGPLDGLPPVVITTGSRDILREQAQALASAIRGAGGQAELHDWPGMWHVFEFYRAIPEAAQSLERIAAFLRRHQTTLSEDAA